VWAALAFVTKLPKPMDIPCVIRVVRCSGTIRKAEEAAVRKAREYIIKAHSHGDVSAGKNNLLGGSSKETEIEGDVDDVDLGESDDNDDDG